VSCVELVNVAAGPARILRRVRENAVRPGGSSRQTDEKKAINEIEQLGRAQKPIKASYLTTTQMIHPSDAHIARLMLMAKIQGHGDEYRRPCEFP
jgi:hypothetical protein